MERQILKELGFELFRLSENPHKLIERKREHFPKLGKEILELPE